MVVAIDNAQSNGRLRRSTDDAPRCTRLALIAFSQSSYAHVAVQEVVALKLAQLIM